MHRIWNILKEDTITVKSAFGRWREAEVGFSASVTDVKNKWRHVSTPLYVFMKCTGTVVPLTFARTP